MFFLNSTSYLFLYFCAKVKHVFCLFNKHESDNNFRIVDAHLMKSVNPQNQQDTAQSPLPKTGSDSIGVDSTSTAVKHNNFRFTDTEPDSAIQAEDTAISRFIPLEGPGLFKNHQLKISHPNARPLNDFTTDWFTVSLIILVGLFTWFRFFYYRIYGQLISAFFNVTVTNQIVRDESVLLQRASLVLSVISYLLAGLFLYQVSVHYNWQIIWLQKGIVRFAMFAVAVASAYSIKMVTLRFLSTVFYQERPVALYIFNIFLTVMMVGLVLLPVNMILAFAPAATREWTIEITVAIIFLIFLYRLVRAVGIWIGIPGFSFFYLFLYLCTFEIAPILVIYKLATL